MSGTNNGRGQHGQHGQGSLFDIETEPVQPAVVVADPDVRARQFAVDPSNNVVLEASAGTGKTSVLVGRYINLLKRGVDPANILAITFTRKAAAEMRERILRELRESAARSEIDRAQWREIRDRLGEIAISTIDAFCLSLLREFPLEADLDPGFDMADETEVPRLIEEALDHALRMLIAIARTDSDVALVFAQLGMSRTREGLALLLERRLVASEALDTFLRKGPKDLTAEVACRNAAIRLQDVLTGLPEGLQGFLSDGPVAHPRYQLLVRELERLPALSQAGTASIRAVLDRIAAHFLTADGKPRKSNTIHPYNASHYPSDRAAKRHRESVLKLGPEIERTIFAFSRDLNVVLARGVRRMFAVALSQYRRTLDERSVLDFSDLLQRALALLQRMDEFSQSRFRLEARYHHVLVDEFQDTSRAQWQLVELLIRSWKEGLGLATQPSIFVVGDRKQSIYRFRDAEAAVLTQASRFIEALRPEGTPKRSITRSFRAVPTLLSLVNEVFNEIADSEPGGGRFTYTEDDRFPIDASVGASGAQRGPLATPSDGPALSLSKGPALGIAVANDPVACAAMVAAEIERILREDNVRDKTTGIARKASAGDIAVLFRSRTSHREFEHELERRSIPTYVYKGLGFFDADETKDAMALIRYLANPVSDLRAAAFLRSRIIRVSDRALAALAPRLAGAILDAELPPEAARLDEEDLRVLQMARTHVPRWLAQVDRIPPAELLETILAECAYAYELRGMRRAQAWENVKKMRGLVRRIQNRGYATFPRIAEHLDALTAGDESNAVLEALDAVNLMTVHASKGLEFPIVFVVNMAKGAGGLPRPVRVIVDSAADGSPLDPSVSVGPFVSEMDEADKAREKHETRRLLYVALTRARDRLYLSSPLKEGALVPGRGSLGEVLPPSMKPLFAAALGHTDRREIPWTTPSGVTFLWKVCPTVRLEPTSTS
jgi:ATP-dependent helicase/nuclease subunit A